MQHISKTTMNFAKSRKLSIDLDFCNDHNSDFIWISVDDDCSEPMFSMFANNDGSFSYRGNIWLNTSTREEIPAFICNEKQLRQVLEFISQDMRNEIESCF